ncbi:MAG: 50S ribosomal protein L35 [Candidatus Babeliales bacterium]
MPKMKTHSGADKRFKKLKSGLVKFSHAFRRHLLTKKTSKRKRQLRRPGYIAACDMNHFRVYLPN